MRKGKGKQVWWFPDAPLGSSCFYCGRTELKPWERQRDHFPIPQRHGGRSTVVACTECHHRKDRQSELQLLEEFNALWWDAERGVVHCYGAILDSVVENDDPETALRTARRVWPALPVTLRLVAARIISNAYGTT